MVKQNPKINGNNVQVKSFGWKVEGGENDAYFSPSMGHQTRMFFHWPPNKDVFYFPSKGYQAWKIPLATKLGTFQGPPSLEPFIAHQVKGLSLPPSSFC